MGITLNGTSGVTTPGVVNSAGETIATTLAVAGAATVGGALTVTGAVQSSGVATNIYPLVSGTSKAYNWNGATTNAYIDFESIPSWVKRITVMFKGVRVNGSSPPLIQLGATTPVITGYLGTGTSVSASVGSSLYTTGFGVGAAASTSAFTRSGSFVISKLTDNTWTCQGAAGQSDAAQTLFSTGAVDVGATLDMVRITTVGGANYFDAGTINIMYE